VDLSGGRGQRHGARFPEHRQREHGRDELRDAQTDPKQAVWGDKSHVKARAHEQGAGLGLVRPVLRVVHQAEGQVDQGGPVRRTGVNGSEG
jgi:hypothetical protein